jgi:hypothetical protein
LPKLNQEVPAGDPAAAVIFIKPPGYREVVGLIIGKAAGK